MACAGRLDSADAYLDLNMEPQKEDDVEVPIGFQIDEEMEEARETDEIASWARKTLGMCIIFPASKAINSYKPFPL